MYGVVLGGFQKLAIHRTCIQWTGTWDMDPWSRGGWSQNTWIVALKCNSKKSRTQYSYSVLLFSFLLIIVIIE